jgi:lipopolysaccharide export system protein LptC
MSTGVDSASDRLDRLVRAPKDASGSGFAYSTMVRSLRLLLPLMALALLLVALLWPQLNWRQTLNTEDIPLAITALETQEIRMRTARLVGSDNEGRPFTVTAEEAQQMDGLLGQVLLTKPQGEMLLADGTRVTFQADEGEYDRTLGKAVFRGNVVVTHGPGYRLQTSIAHVDVKDTRAYGDQSVSGKGPEGDLSGSGFEILDRGKTVKVLGRSKLVINEVPNKQ